MCSAASPPYSAYRNLELLIFFKNNFFLFGDPTRLLSFFSIPTRPLPHNVLCFVSTLRGIELQISHHFDFFNLI